MAMAYCLLPAAATHLRSVYVASCQRSGGDGSTTMASLLVYTDKVGEAVVSDRGLLLLALLVLVVFCFWFRSIRQKNSLSPIPGVEMVPGGHWLFGHMSKVTGPIKTGTKDWFDHLFVDYANEEGISCAYYFEPVVSVLSAKHARTILRQTSKRKSVKVIHRHLRKTLGQHSLIFQSGGPEWKRQRGQVQYALNANAIVEHNSIIFEVANAMVTALTNLCKMEANSVIEMDVVHVAQCFTLETFGKLALGHDFHCFSSSGVMRSREAEAFAFLVNDIPKRSNPRAILNPTMQMYSLPTTYNKKYWSERGIVESLLSSVIQRSKDDFVASTKRDSSESCNGTGRPGKKIRDNLLTHIIRTSADNSEERLVDMMKTILFAGNETTAITITFVLYNLTKYPEFQKHCCEEARRILQQENVTISDLRWTRAVIMESMRIQPTVIWTSRDAHKPIELDGKFTIPKGCRIVIPLIKLLADDRNFERAKEFIPTRWVRWSAEKNEWIERDYRNEPTDHGEVVSAADPANFLAFSDGARDCVGKRLAMNESTVALASLMKNFRVSHDESKPVEMKRRLTSWFPHELDIKFHLRDTE